MRDPKNSPTRALAAPLFFILISLQVGASEIPTADDAKEKRVLVFSETEGWWHDSIPAGRQAIIELGSDHGFAVDTTANLLTDSVLSTYDAIVFLNTTLDVLDTSGQIALMRYVQAGGGYVGIHSAADTEYDWPWYGQLVGAYLDGHPNDPNVREGIITVADHDHQATAHLPVTWIRRDEWYDYRYVNPNVNVLLTVDEKSYKRPDEKPTSDAHPIAWFHEYDGGRSFYTGLGHTIESFAEPLYRRHLLGGIRYAMGEGDALNYRGDGVRPLPTQFRKVIMEDDLNEPMELDLLPDGRVMYIERHGRVWIHDPRQGATETAAKLTVTTLGEDGLLGIAVDPNHARNRWVYLYYSPADDPPRQRLSRFELAGNRIRTSTEIVMLEIPTQRSEPKPGCCHSGGSLEFDASGNLYLSTGDNTNPFESNGFAPVDERPDREIFDAQRTAANSADLRGKILRIRPTPDGSYSIPNGNLFPADGSRGRPEIYIMGNRNPFRISIDHRSGDLFWGEVGPDAGRDSTLGPKGYDEVNRASAAGNYGWPYAIADNQVYADYNFTTDGSERRFDCVDPENDSPNNSGARRLPPCRPAWIWYPYDKSDRFPLLGSGGRTAMAGPVYRYKSGTGPPGLPKYYDGELFIYEWMRGWIAAVDIDSPGWPPVMQSFMPDAEFSRPMDMVIDGNGVLYLLEYGTEWEAQNPDARLARIDYRAAEDAIDAESESRLAAAEASGQPGLSKPYAGEERGHLASSTSTGEDMVRASDCMACHKVKEPSIGPSFVAIADRYRDQYDVVNMLAAKVRTGGSGVWGSQPMVPHPQHSADEIEAMVAYILSLQGMED